MQDKLAGFIGMEEDLQKWNVLSIFVFACLCKKEHNVFLALSVFAASNSAFCLRLKKCRCMAEALVVFFNVKSDAR